jgi:hypothetical protein
MASSKTLPRHPTPSGVGAVASAKLPVRPHSEQCIKLWTQGAWKAPRVNRVSMDASFPDGYQGACHWRSICNSSERALMERMQEDPGAAKVGWATPSTDGEWLGPGLDEGHSSLVICSVMCGSCDLEMRNSSERIWPAKGLSPELCALQGSLCEQMTSSQGMHPSNGSVVVDPLFRAVR